MQVAGDRGNGAVMSHILESDPTVISSASERGFNLRVLGTEKQRPTMGAEKKRNPASIM